MAEVSLTAIVRYKGDTPPSPVRLANIQFPKGKKPPEGGYAALYGFRDALDEISRQRREADAAKDHILSIDISVDVGEIIIGVMHIQQLPTTKFLNMRRMSKELNNLVVRYWEGYLRDEGVSEEAIAKQSFWQLQHVADRPDLVGRLWKENEFNHLAVIAYPVNDKGVARQVATLFRKEAITKIEPKTGYAVSVIV